MVPRHNWSPGPSTAIFVAIDGPPGPSKAIVHKHKPKIIGITESWCNSDVTNAEISFEHYNLYRCDKKAKSGGGVLLYIHNSLTCFTCNDLDILEINDAVWVIISLTKANKLLVGLIYRSPYSDTSNNQKLIVTIANLHSTQRYSSVDGRF